MKTIVLYPGTFSPFHIGHLNIIQKSEKIFGINSTVVAMGINPDKIAKLVGITKDEYIKKKEIEASILSKKLGREVVVYYDFLHQLVERYEALKLNVVVVRGLRNGHDLDYEVNQLRFVSDFKKNVNVVYITCDKEFEHISSSAIRKIEEFGGHEMSKQYLIE
jgi:pantetheine-phosphate adenylyltransferase